MDISLRRAAVRASTYNAIDSVEVIDRFVIVRLFKAASHLTARNVRIEGGVRINPVNVVWALPLAAVPSSPDNAVLSGLSGGDLVFVVRTDSAGDFSTYRLRLVDADHPSLPPDGFDPRLSEIDFSFKLDCPPELDEPSPAPEATPLRPEPEIDYLAKDYASFRRLMLDRLSAVSPEWRERNPADLGVALVELLAYVGDQLSYFQDAVATEAYLGTARQRISMRRHARLAGYTLSEGKNARTWVVIELDQNLGFVLPAHLPLLTRGGGDEVALAPGAVLQAVSQGATVFETLHDVFVHRSRNEIEIYTWTGSQTVLPAGATAATLVLGPGLLSVGELLLFEEIVSPRTGEAADADPRHRHAVRLTSVEETRDPLTQTSIVEIAWDTADALPFPLVLSATTDPGHGARYLENVSVARGNVVLADHGWTLPEEEDLGTVPTDRPFRPLLQQGPLTHARPLPAGFERLPAAVLMRDDAAAAVPALQVRVPATGEIWTPRQDLVSSSRFAPELVAEIREDGRALLRFGNDVNGKAPNVGAAFAARYRIGQGTAGNLGADALRYIGIDPDLLPGETEYQRNALADFLRTTIVGVRNPLPARLGQDPESLAEARRFAPQAFLTRQRAVTEADWAALAGQHPEVQRAAASLRWTGSWRTVSLFVDRLGGAPVDAELIARLRRDLEPYLIAGYDLEIRGPQLVALDLALLVCAKPGYFRRQIETAVAERLDNRNLFHPDRWTFGQPVTLDRIYSAVREIEGVESVRALRFQRWGRPAGDEIDCGVLPIGPLEIAVLDNDPDFRENGRLEIQIGGGR